MYIFIQANSRQISPYLKLKKSLLDLVSQTYLKHQYNVKVIFLKNGHLNLEKENNGVLNIVEASRLNMDTTVSSAGNSNELDLAFE